MCVDYLPTAAYLYFYKPLVKRNPDGTKPHIERFPDSQTAVEGKTVSFLVLVTGVPAPNITWYHDNSRIKNDYAHEVATDGSLTIYTAEMKHSGLYRMVAANSIGSKVQTLKFSVVRDDVQVTAPPLQPVEPPPRPSKISPTVPNSRPAAPPPRPTAPPPRPTAPPPRPAAPPSRPVASPLRPAASPLRPAASSYGKGTAINVSHFGSYVSQNHANTNKGFRALYSVSLVIVQISHMHALCCLCTVTY